MSEEDKSTAPTAPNKLPVGPNSPKPESPTTARPLDFDDEPQESGVTSVTPGTAQQQGEPEAQPEAPPAAPPKPPRPLSPRQQSENTLKEAFPTLESSVIKAVLVASNWNLERAFHALLGMTDPNAQEEDIPPAKPPRPTAAQRQMEADEVYARQLAEHYNRRAQPSRLDDEARYRQRRGSEASDERDYSFFDDDLPVIRDNIRKGFVDTQTKVNSWVQNLKKQWNAEEGDDAQPSRSYGDEQNYSRARRSGDLGRRSGDRERYDADPQLLDDDFAGLELRDSEAPPPRPPRPLANQDLYKTSSSSPDRRKVSFQEGPPAEIGSSAYGASEAAKPAPSTGGKSSKWQPLTTVEPSPVGEHDPFSLGDSEDEKDTKAKEQNTPASAAVAGDASSASKDDNNKAKDAGKS